MPVDFVKSARFWLDDMLIANDSEAIVYCPAGDETNGIPMRACPRRTRLNSKSAEHTVIAAGECDFIITREDYPPDPVPGDIILYDGQRFEVSTCYDWHSVGTASWKWCNGYFTARRVHTKIADTDYREDDDE